MDTTDIAVIGGGPAGTSFARLAGGRYRVTVLDRRGLSSPPAGVGKCCGGLLSPDAQHSLAALGLNLPLDVLVDPQIFAVRTMDLKMETERYYQRPYVNMNRERFDRWLASLLPSSVRMLDRAVRRSHRSPAAAAWGQAAQKSLPLHPLDPEGYPFHRHRQHGGAAGGKLRHLNSV